MNAKSLLAVLLLTVAAPSQALFDQGNIGLPTNPGTFDPGDPLPPPPPPQLPPIGIHSVGLTSIEISVRPPAGRTSQLFRQAPLGAYAPFQAVTPGVESVIRDTQLGVGKDYCYRIQITGGGLPDETHTRCATTDWRVGFEGLSISQAESAEVLRLFDWRDTQRLAEGTPDAPALYHMNLLIEDADPLAEQGFRTMGMHLQPRPIFPEELEGWNEAKAIAQDCPVGPIVADPVLIQAMARGPLQGNTAFGSCTPAGRWFFAAVPGGVYNEIRARMLEQIGRGEKPGIRALVFRRVPVSAALAPGVSRHVLNYSYLGEQGFEFNGIRQCFVEGGVRYCQTQQEILGWLARKVIYWVVELGDAIVEGVRTAIGRIQRLVKGELDLEIQFRLLNTDPAFGTDQVMRSGWSGEEIKLAGVKVEVRQGLAGFYEHTDANGYVKLKVAKNSNTKVCLQLENDTAEITEFLIETTVCVKSLGKLTGNRSEIIDVREEYANVLAGMTDARSYMKVVAGHSMPKITVLVGGNAMLLGAMGRSFAPCMGRVPSLLGLGADLVGLLGSFLSPGALLVTTSIEFLYSVDIVLLPTDDSSRGVAVHEYGHAVMCDMLLKQGLDAFEFAWTDVIRQSASQGAGDQASYLNEAFADFLTAQILGGTNYFPTTSSVESESVNYCPAGGSCLERNYDASDTSGLSSDAAKAAFQAQVRRVAATLQDAFDGQAGTDAPNDASHWQVSAPYAQLTAHDSDQSDEAVVLSGRDVRDLFSYWDARGTLLREDNFLGGLADLAKARGYGEAEVCALFALHEAGRTCPGFIARQPWLDWMDVTDGGLLEAFGFAPAPTPVPVPFPNSAQAPALMLAIAAGAPDVPGEQPGSEPEDTCTDCSRPVVFEGVQKIQVPGLGKDERDTAFAFRLGEGSFEGIDPLGQLYQGAWKPRNSRGSKLRLHLSPEAADKLARLLVASGEGLGLEPGSALPTGPAKIELRLAKGGALIGKITVPFEVEVDGRVKRGTYVAKLRSSEA
jgi:hypothetical protein